MSIGRTNASGGSLSKSVIVATAPAGSTVTCTNGSVTKTAIGKASTNIFDTALFPSLTVENMTFTSSTDGVLVKGVTSGHYERTSINLPLDLPAIKLSVRAVGLPGDWNLFVGCICTRANGTKDYYDISADNGTTTAELREGDTERVFYVSTNQDAGVSINAFVRVAVVEGTTPPSKVEPYYEGERFIFSGLSDGMWGVVATKDGKTATKSVTLARMEVVYITLNYNTVPEFTYTGDFEIVDDDDNPITTSQGDWKIRFLTSGTLTFTNLNGAGNGIDVFAVGAGGSGGVRSSSAQGFGAGGGGGYTQTERGVELSPGVAYEIVIGSGGAESNSVAGNQGGATSGFGVTANGGFGSKQGTSSGNVAGGNGGSGGGAGAANYSNGPNAGGTDGGDGVGPEGNYGIGQGTTTREFGEADAKLYATGGTGGVNAVPKSGGDNTGDGGEGCNAAKSKTSGAGGSGIVIIRNHREGAA